MRSSSTFRVEMQAHRIRTDNSSQMGLVRIKKVKPRVDKSFLGSKGIFAFQDYRVAELVTVFAWIDLLEMKQLAKDQFKMDILYGDTDSILVACINVEQDYSADAFTITCKRNLGVDVNHENTLPLEAYELLYLHR